MNHEVTSLPSKISLFNFGRTIENCHYITLYSHRTTREISKLLEILIQLPLNSQNILLTWKEDQFKIPICKHLPNWSFKCTLYKEKLPLIWFCYSMQYSGSVLINATANYNLPNYFLLKIIFNSINSPKKKRHWFQT